MIFSKIYNVFLLYLCDEAQSCISAQRLPAALVCANSCQDEKTGIATIKKRRKDKPSKARMSLTH